MPLWPLKEVYYSALLVCARLLVRYVEFRVVHYSGVRFVLLFSYIGGSAGALVECLLDKGVRFLECLL